jgi:outer membrane cobalamin receptor
MGLRFSRASAALVILPGLCCAEPAMAQAAKPAPAAPSTIVVTAQPAKSQALLDRQVYVVSGDLQSTTGSAADVLNLVPSVDVNPDGGVALRGDSNVTILVDGKPSAALSGAAAGTSLLQFPASDIDRIEVMTNPPAQYKASGSGGVINIITKKTRKAGLSGTLRANGGEAGRAVLGADGTYNAGPLKLTGGLGFRQEMRERLTTDNRIETVAGQPPGQSAQSVDEHFRRLTPSVKAGIDYELNKRQTVGVGINVSDMTGHRYFDQTNTGGPAGGASQSLSTRHSDGYERHIEQSAEGHFAQKLWRPDETLSLSLQQSGVREQENYFYTNAYRSPPAPNSFDDLSLGLDLIKTEFNLDYDLPFGEAGDLKLGYALESDLNDFNNFGDSIDAVSGRRTLNPAISNHFRYRQTVNALYGAYDRTIGPWRMQAGLRAEGSAATWRLITGNIPGAQREWGLYPSLQLARALGDMDKLTVSLSRRVTRPDPESVNPFTDNQDVFNPRAGNPNLRPQDTWSGQLAYVHSGAFGYGVTAYYREDRDSFTSVSQPEGAGVVLTTQANLPLARSGGVEFSANGKLGQAFSYNLSGQGFWSQIDARPLGAVGLKATSGLNLKASVEYRPTAADTLQISLSRTDRKLTPQGFIAAIELVNLGYRRQLRPDLAAVFTLSDAFNGQKQLRLVQTLTLTDAYQRYQIGRIAMIGLVWSFGGPAKGKANDFQYDQ